MWFDDDETQGNVNPSGTKKRGDNLSTPALIYIIHHSME